MNFILAIVNRSKVPTAEVRKVIAAANKQLKGHFGPAWNLAGRCKLVTGQPEPHEITEHGVLYLDDDVKVDGVMGYHDTIANTGMPFGYVYTSIAERLSEPWSVTFSHEVLEIMLNKQVNMYARGPHPKKPGKIVDFWLEACDAVQGSTYCIDGVELSNFVLPSYFTVSKETNKANDFLMTGSLRSFGLLPGGYVGFTDPTTGEDDSVFADNRAHQRYEIKADMGGTRRTSRKVPVL